MLNKELQEHFTGKKRSRVIEALEVSHAETGMNYKICKYSSDLTLTLEDSSQHLFTGGSFAVQLPEYEENGNLDMTITFPSVDFSIISEIESIIKRYDSPIIIKYRFYLENSYKYPQMTAPFIFTVSAVEINNRTVSFAGGLLIGIREKVPTELYTVENFRALKYVT